MATAADRIVQYARAQLGDPYVWGAEGPDGFDCSGLVYAAYKAAGLPVSRTTAANLGRQGQAVPLADARPGDLAYFDNPGTTDHVAIVSAPGRMIEAPTFGVPVREVPLRAPTSIRRMPGVQGTLTDQSNLSPAGESGASGDAGGGGGGIFGPLTDLFSGWQNDVQTVGLKVLAAGAAAAFVIIGAKTALQDKG